MSFARHRLLWCSSVVVALALDARALQQNAGEWQTLASTALARQETGAARVGNSVYLVGGLLSGPSIVATDLVEVYDIASNTWSSGVPLPAARDHMGVAELNGELYVVGGFAGDFAAKSQVWSFSPASNTWTPRPALPEARGGLWVVSFGGRLFAFGGVDATGTARATTSIFDPIANQWTGGADMPTPREHLNAAVLGSFIHVVGGRSGASTGAHERYNPANNTWGTLIPLPTARSATATAVFGGKLFVMGGEIPQLFALNEVYDPVNNHWTRQADMPLPRHGIAAVALDDRILTPAGGTIQGLQPTNVVDSFVPLSNDAAHVCFCSSNSPCGNPDQDAGCLNSTGQGAVLSATGNASVGNDTLRLVGSSMPANANSLYLQGSELDNGGAGTPLFDGKRCVGGTVVRLGLRTSSGGASVFPGPGGVPISIRGGASAGATRFYQTWYRNPAGPCGTFANWSSAVRVNWTM